METPDKKIIFQDYYKKLPELQGELRSRIVDKLEIKSIKTFYNKLNADSWSAIEREAIDKIVEDFNNELSEII